MSEKKKFLAELNVKRQIEDILTNELLMGRISQYNGCVRGLILTKEEQLASHEFFYNSIS